MIDKSIYIDSTSVVNTTQIGEGSKIWQFCIVLEKAKIGMNCNINSHCFIENKVIIGNNVTLKCGVYLWDGIEVKDNVFIGPNATFTNDLYPRSKHYPSQYQKTIIYEGASIGANSTIIGGVTIGAYAMIGAGSVVTKNIPSHSLWFGNPAEFKGYVCKCGKKVQAGDECKICGYIFHVHGSEATE